jgi:Ca-activated chloride channel family protein
LTAVWTLTWWWMLAALPLPWLVRRFARADAFDRDAALKVPFGAEFSDLAGMRSLQSARLRLAALSAIWVLALLAAARPQFIGEPVALPMTGRDLLLIVDLSGSMEEQDFQLNGQWVDRLTALKAVAKDFIERRVGDRVGLILFGREAYLQTPLTFDRKTVKTLLDESVIGLAGKETAIGDAIGLAIRTLDDAGVEQGRRVAILLTDGANTAGAVDPLKAAELAAQRNLVIYTIGIGADALTVRSLFGVRQINPSAGGAHRDRRKDGRQVFPRARHRRVPADLCDPRQARARPVRRAGVPADQGAVLLAARCGRGARVRHGASGGRGRALANLGPRRRRVARHVEEGAWLTCTSCGRGGLCCCRQAFG